MSEPACIIAIVRAQSVLVAGTGFVTSTTEPTQPYLQCIAAPNSVILQGTPEVPDT